MQLATTHDHKHIDATVASSIRIQVFSALQKQTRPLAKME